MKYLKSALWLALAIVLAGLIYGAFHPSLIRKQQTKEISQKPDGPICIPWIDCAK